MNSKVVKNLAWDDVGSWYVHLRSSINLLQENIAKEEHQIVLQTLTSILNLFCDVKWDKGKIKTVIDVFTEVGCATEYDDEAHEAYSLLFKKIISFVENNVSIRKKRNLQTHRNKKDQPSPKDFVCTEQEIQNIKEIVNEIGKFICEYGVSGTVVNVLPNGKRIYSNLLAQKFTLPD